MMGECVRMWVYEYVSAYEVKKRGTKDQTAGRVEKRGVSKNVWNNMLLWK